MNFQAIEQANGNQVTIFGTFTEVGGAQFTANQKAKAVCKIRDTTGVEKKVHIYQGKGQLPTLQNLNQRCQFTLSSFQGNYQGAPYTGYSGFWNDNPQVNQNAPQNAPQTPQNVPQATSGKNEVDWDAKDQRNANMNALNNATAFLTTCAQVSNNIASWLSQDKIKDVAANFAEFIYNNKTNLNEEVVSDESKPEGFCTKCGKPLSENCACDDIPF